MPYKQTLLGSKDGQLCVRPHSEAVRVEETDCEPGCEMRTLAAPDRVELQDGSVVYYELWRCYKCGLEARGSALSSELSSYYENADILSLCQSRS